MAFDPAEVADGAEVTVVTGTQFGVNVPSNPAASENTRSTTTTTTTVPSSGPIAASSPATSRLQPWGPKACPTGARPSAPVPNRT